MIILVIGLSFIRRKENSSKHQSDDDENDIEQESAGPLGSSLRPGFVLFHKNKTNYSLLSFIRKRRTVFSTGQVFVGLLSKQLMPLSEESLRSEHRQPSLNNLSLSCSGNFSFPVFCHFCSSIRWFLWTIQSPAWSFSWAWWWQICPRGWTHTSYQFIQQHNHDCDNDHQMAAIICSLLAVATSTYFKQPASQV